jgi:hypothetical protein
MLEVHYVWTGSGQVPVCHSCPKCGTLAPRTTLRGVLRLVACPLCETEYAHRAPMPAIPPPRLRKRSWVTAFAEWLGVAP